MTEEIRDWAQTTLTGNARTGVLKSLEILPKHLVPRVLLDSQSPWAIVDTIPGPCFAIWLATGEVYAIGEDGMVEEKPQ